MVHPSNTPVSPVRVSQPEFTISPPSINSEPVELDDTSTSPDRLRRGSRPAALEEMTPEERERREKLHSERQADPAVMVDIPKTPQAEELQMSGAMDEASEPGVMSSQNIAMYVDSNPASSYKNVQGWRMPSPQPTGTLKRPSILKYDSSNSSASSLKGMEQTVPSFQSFVNRTPPVDDSKPLPPTPLQPRRPSSFNSDSGTSRTASSFGRRSSSVYSRTVSQWDPDWASEVVDVPDVPALPTWRGTEPIDQDNLLLGPIAYSASTSKLLEKLGLPPVLEARTYSPLINTPSPTVSQDSSPSSSPPPHFRASLSLPSPPPAEQLPKKARMVSLSQAKALVQAPGAVHLLPEELRAQTLGKARSQEPLRVDSMAFFAVAPPRLPAYPTLVDSQGRERLISSAAPLVTLTQPADSYLSVPERSDSRLFHDADGTASNMAPLALQNRKASRDKITQALGINDADEPRGRTQTRGPRNISYDHYIPKTKRISDSSKTSSESQSDAQKIAQEYHALLSEQYRQASNSPMSNTSVSDCDVGTHMKMVPQPLFHTKPAARLRGEISSFQDSNHSISPSSTRANSTTDAGPLRKPSYTRGSFPLRLSNSLRRRRSTSGSIPISPPSVFTHEMSTVAPRAPELQPKKPAAPRRKAEDDRKSAYYPHVMSRKPKKEKKDKVEKKEKGAGRSKQIGRISSPLEAPPIPMLAADIIAQRSNTSEGMSDYSPIGKRPIQDDMRSDSEAASVYSNKSPLHQRMIKSAVKYADKLTSPISPQGGKGSYFEQPISHRRVASAESPHLLPSPSSGKSPSEVHLGWTEHAKAKFDWVQSSVQSPKFPPPLVTHTITASKPLDDSKAGLYEPESPGPGRKKSINIFGGLMEGWRETKAEKRRDDLKKMIKLVQPAEEDVGGESANEGRPSIVRKGTSFSSFGWM